MDTPGTHGHRITAGALLGPSVVSSLLAAQAILAQTPQPLRDDRTAARVEVQEVTTLRFQDAAVAPDLETQVIRLPDGRWGATSRVFGGIVPLFSAAGSHTGTLGHPGPGPGEFKDPRFAIGVGEQLWVVDPGNNRLTAFGSDDTPIGDRTLPGRVVQVQPTAHGGGLLLSGFFDGASGVVHTTARVSMNGADDRFGGDPGTSHDVYVQYHLAAETPSGEIWAVARSGGDIQILRADDLEPLASSHLPEDLSRPERHEVRSILTERPAPAVAGAMVDAGGVLWIVMGVADEHWRARPDLDRHAQPPVEELFDTLILALSTQDRAIIGARRVDRFCLPVLDALISCANEDEETIDILRLGLER